MKSFLKENWKFLLFVLVCGLIGGYCIGLYSYDSLSEEALKQLEEQGGTKELVAIASAVQYGIPFGALLAAVGIIISKKVNLWQEFKADKRAIIDTAIIAVVGALVLFPGDKLIFGSLSAWVNEQYTAKPTVYKLIGGLLVGGVIEEVMMRLFLMSLLAFIVSKLFYKNKEIPAFVFVVANVVAALLFAAGHLPSTATMTALTPVIILRCFLFNGGLGVAFGYLYQKHGVGYAMIAHGLCHLIADTLMLIFI
ncbi:MAG: CPBP family intramembrane metalloprotease [Clostridia bacterium]|nr:CPBP family intramembrane metalloprotease [Clostridia bacterium]